MATEYDDTVFLEKLSSRFSNALGFLCLQAAAVVFFMLSIQTSHSSEHCIEVKFPENKMFVYWWLQVKGQGHFF